MILPAQSTGATADTEPSSSPVLPTSESASSSSPARSPVSSIAADAPPTAVYPSDELDSGALGSGSDPVPLLSSAIDRHGFPAVWAQGFHGEGVNAAVIDQGLDFGHPDLNSSYAIEGNTSSPYYGWPLAFDSKSMATYIRTGFADGTWYANTTRKGPGPFEITHKIKVDGTNDFGRIEQVGQDPRDSGTGSPGGDKEDYDLTDLYMTRDEDRWYFGFTTWLRQSNDTYVLLLDMDNETGGTTTVPAGKRADTNTSHADVVTDVAFSPNGSQVATIGADRYLRVWDLSGHVLYSVQAHTAKPSSVAWSPDGTMIATADPNMLLIWDAVSGQVRWPVQYVPLADSSIDENAVLAWSPNSTWVAAGTKPYVHIINAQTGQRFGTLWASASAPANAVRFNSLGTQIAVGLGDPTGSIPVFDVNAANIQPYPPVSRATAAFTLTGVHTNAVLDIAWKTGDQWMVSGGKDNRVVLWDVAARTGTGNTGSGSWVTGVEWRKDGLGFVSVSAGLLTTPPKLMYWDNAGFPQQTVNMKAAMTGVDTSSTLIVTSSADLSARFWDTGGNPTGVKVLVFHKPDAAIVANGWSRYSERDQSFVHGLDIATFYRWNATSGRWEGTGFFDKAVNGTQATFDYGSLKGVFNELSIPRDRLGDPAALSVELFSAGRAGTKPQDCVPGDPNVNFKNLELSLTSSFSLGAFAYRRPGSYTIDPAIVSLNNTFHFGYHPSPILTRAFGPIGLLVVDAARAGKYDTVYVDLNNNQHFDLSDVKLTRDSPVASLDTIDHVTGLPGTDGIADISGGLLYFISNGTVPIPYSTRYVALQLPTQPTIVNRIPGNGDLLGFVGEFGLDAITGAKLDHGTRIASILVGQGLLDPPAQGVAPATKLVALGNALDDVVSSWYFAVEGYDGLPGTGDEAQVVLNPFNYPTLPNDGFDVYSRTADYLSYVYTKGRALFVAPTGEYGFGYGSIASPASTPAVLAVGRAEDGTYRSQQEGGTEGPNPHYLDIAGPSARGPSSLGIPKPDLIAIGAATADVPIQSAPGDGTTAVSSGPMIGTDVAATIAAGGAIVTYQAYLARWGRAPSVDELMALLRSGAADLSYDAFLQGSGFLDVTESVRLARGAGGVLVSPSTLVPGTYRGTRTAAYPRLIVAGGSDTLSLRLENRGTATTTMAITDAAYTRVGIYTFANSTVQDPYASNGDITFWLNASGISKVNGTVFTVTPLTPPIPAWASVDLVRVTAVSDVDRFVYKTGTTYTTNYSYTLSAMDWDVNGTNWLGLPYGPFPAPGSFPNELNTIMQTSNQANALEVRARKPAASVHDGLVIRLSETVVGSGLLNTPWTFTVELFQRVDWGWVTPSPGSVTLTAGENTSVNVRIDVPLGTGLGLYEGLVLVANTSSGRTAVVPVVVNVGATGTDFSFGGNAANDLYDNSQFYCGNDFALTTARTGLQRQYMGDWRFYYIDIPTAGMFENPRGLKLVVDLRWLAKPSDLDIQVFGRAAADMFSTSAGDRYGPAPLSVRGKTDELNVPDFKTVTNESEDVLTVDLRAGLNVIAIHVTRLKGDVPWEVAAGFTGWARTRPNVDISTPNLAGQASFTFLSSLNLTGGLRASAVGPATTNSSTDVPIQQDYQSWWNFPNFGEFLWRGSYNFTFNMTKALILEVHIKGKADVSDLDLGVFRDINLNGKLDEDEVKDANSKNRGGNDWMYDADGDADETVKWLSPPDGQYFVKVLGFTLYAIPGHFDIDVSITLATGKGYEVPQAPKPSEIVQGTEAGLPPFTSISFTMAWDLPGETKDGDYGGAVLMGFPNAPGVLVIPVSVGIDREAPVVAGFTIAALAGLLNEADNRTTTDPSPKVTWSVTDSVRGELDDTRFSLTLDGVDVTSDADVTVQLTQNALLVYGFWEGTVLYSPRQLSEGIHELRLTAGDMAGNLVTHVVTLILDTTAPPIAIEGASPRFTRDPYATITAVSQSGMYVSFGGPWILMDATGRVTTSVALSPGANVVRVTAADWFGNDAFGNPVPGNANSAAVTVILDTMPPGFSRRPSADATVTRSDGAVIRGTVQEFIAPGVTWPASDVTLTVAGTRTAVEADGTFVATVPLTEGDNTIEVLAVDLAGNQARAWANVTRDTQAPALDVDPVPTQVTSGFVTISGQTEVGALVTVNGVVVPVMAGQFSRMVSMSGGANTIVVRAEDPSGNVAEQRFSVEFVAEPTPMWQWMAIGATVVIVAFLLVFLLARNYLFPPEQGPTPMPEAWPAVEPPTATPAEVPKMPETPRVEPGPDERAERLERAYKEGKISRDAYEQNMVRLGRTPTPGQPPAVAPAPVAAPAEAEEDEFAMIEEESTEEEPAEEEIVEEEAVASETAEEPEGPRAAKLREAYESGRISRDAYEANMKRLGIAVKTPAAAEDPRVTRLREAFESGKITREVYEANLRRLGKQS